MSGVGLSEKIISIHALAKRATRITTCTAYDAVISIHALAKRATEAFTVFFLTKLYFNPRPRKEGD